MYSAMSMSNYLPIHDGTLRYKSLPIVSLGYVQFHSNIATGVKLRGATTNANTSCFSSKFLPPNTPLGLKNLPTKRKQDYNRIAQVSPQVVATFCGLP